ncbi:sensor domain-containing protein [Streptomyces sp. BHT-5-2]|uniref:sensor histidine kinase n=1 Tax=unclassified Streptomyces TaxID=2593676 RepID=UPI001C8E6971|nr:histidine kinase [Streptomyces sp. BHT-5-2]QZL06315.1 sensor domain-containing protein [Streptomyces sp. BHT-5-2]
MRVRRTLVAAGRGLVLAVVVEAGSVALLVLILLSLAFMVIGVGFLTTPLVLSWARGYADLRRVWAYEQTGVRIPAGYRPFPPRLRRGPAGRWQRCAVLLRDPATWRELLWLPVDLTLGLVLALLPSTLVVYGAGFVLLPVAQGLTGLGGQLLGFGSLTTDHPVLLAVSPVLGAGLLALALRANPALLRAHFELAAVFLTPPKAELAARVARLTETRHDAVDGSAAELRRIERDLHDGAQARLVAMGMSLGTIETLIEKDPARAKELVGRAREASAEALTELRDLVRGIHPPVLAERGLGDAVRALALRMEIPVEVTVQLPRRLAAPLESAAYFAVGELLTNAAKHSGADRIEVDVRHTGGRLLVTVGDNGRGGAAVRPAGAGGGAEGSGLRGVERRLGTFDGVLAVSSPAGGPTLVTMEIPCA